MQLAGKRIVVTGAGRGIGEAVVRAMAAEGAHVAALDVLDEACATVAREVGEDGPGRVIAGRCDVSIRADVQEALASAVDALGGLDALVNVAGVERRAPAESITDEEFRLIIDVNLRGTFLTNQVAFPYLRDNGGGRIVNFGSAAALAPYVNGAHYSASKGAVISWTRTIAHEWGRHGIAANVVNPVAWTQMYEEARARYSVEELPAHEELIAQLIPLGGKPGDPARDVAPVVVFLVSAAARFITGQIVAIDGGMAPLR